MSNSKILSNRVVPKYVPTNLRWDQKEGLNAWYLQGLCSDFIEDVDNHFFNIQITHFDMINNDLPKSEIQQYKTFDYESINQYPEAIKNEIREAVCRNIKKSNFHVDRQNVLKILQEQNKTVARGRGRFLKICCDSMYASCW